MFKFTLPDKFRKQGVSPGAIPPEMRNRFDARFEEDGKLSDLDSRIQIRLDEKVVRFFYYTDDINAEVLIEEKYKEIASISLTNAKETGHDILFFKKKIERKCSELKSSDVFKEEDDFKKKLNSLSKNLVEKSEGKGSRLNGFPFVKSWKYNEKDSIENWFTFFLQCCFLYFLFEFESRKSDFPNSPIYGKVRDKLSQSDVYQLLCAKMKYTMRLYEGEAPMSEDDYGIITQKFVDRLMDKDLNKVIPPDYYNEQLWFYNPETELDFIVKRNAKNCKRKGEAKLSDKLLDKIRNFFFTKHAVVSAMGKPWMKIVYWIYISMIGAFSAYATWCLLNFDSGKKMVNLFFNNIVVWDWVAAISIVLLVVLWMCTKSLSVFMPRVLVAIGIGWLTTFISEDIIKSQVTIEIPLTVAACIGVFLLISILLIGEIRQHSPYYWGKLQQYHDDLLKKRSKDSKDGWISKLVGFLLWLPAFLVFLFDWNRAEQPSSWKLTPILIHSYFWTLSLGVIMQLVLYKGLLEHSRALPEIVYEQTFDKANNYGLYLNNLRDVLVSYEDDWMALCSGSSRSTGTSKNNLDLSFIKMYPDPNFPRYAERFRLKTKDIMRKYDAVMGCRKEIWGDWKKNHNNKGILERIKYNKCKSKRIKNFYDLGYGKTNAYHLFSLYLNNKGISERIKYNKGISERIKSFYDLGYGNTNAYHWFFLYSKLMKPIKKLDTNGLPEETIYNEITEQLLFLDVVIFQTEEEIRNNRLFMTNDDNWDSLIVWSEYERVNCEFSPKNIQDCLKMTAVYEKNLCRKANDLWWIKKEGENNYLFPRMLIFHSLIVMIIAFVGQLIIFSDKSVTEPL